MRIFSLYSYIISVIIKFSLNYYIINWSYYCVILKVHQIILLLILHR